MWNTKLSLVSVTSDLCVVACCLIVLGYNAIGGADASSLLRHRQRDNTKSMPYFLETNKNLTVHPGNRAVLKCRIENLGTKMVTWRKAGEINPLTIGYFTFSPDTRINLDYNQRTREWSLVIQSVRPEDEGWYHCQVSTKEDSELFYAIKLNVLTVQITGTDYVVVGSQLRLICNATGKPDPPHDVKWYKNGERLESDADRGIIITKKIETKVLVSMLVIKEVKLSDKAVYMCESSNRDSAELPLNVLDPAIAKGKRDKGKPRQPVSPSYRGIVGIGRASSSLHRQYPYVLPVVCFSIGWLLQDTRWLS